jgi:cytochrome c556
MMNDPGWAAKVAEMQMAWSKQRQPQDVESVKAGARAMEVARIRHEIREAFRAGFVAGHTTAAPNAWPSDEDEARAYSIQYAHDRAEPK